MLTIKNWKNFWIYNFTGFLIFFIPIVFLTLLFSSGFVYLGKNTSSIFSMILRSQPYLVFYSVLKVISISMLICIGLHFISSSYNKKYRIAFGLLFFSSAILRVASLYPAISEKWFIINNFNNMRKFVQYISLLPLTSHYRLFINWMPFILSSIIFIINFFIYMTNILKQGRIVQKARNSIYVDELDTSSKVFSIQGLSFLLFIIFGGIFLNNLNSSMEFKLPRNNTKQIQPNIFIFSIDSLRYDRLHDSTYKDVMPFLKNRLKDSVLFKPMLVGVPRTFPSWVEISTGSYSLNTGIRTMFPSRSSRQGKKNTIFEISKENGYSTIFISDFAGDIFPRYPFGGMIVDAPSSNLKTLVENGIISLLTPVQSVLLLPNLQRIFPSLLANPEIADPRLVANAAAKNLTQVANYNKPIFLTLFFSSAHFPYASPGPWYGKFQNKCLYEENNPCKNPADYLFQKIPDQALSNKEAYKLNHPTKEIKEQTISLYDGGLNSIDFVLKEFIEELEKKGWLENSLIFIFGDHGENLYDGDMGMGHGDGVEGEFSNVTPLIIFSKGNISPSFINNSPQQFVRTVDIAPTIAKRLQFDFNYHQLDGIPLLDKLDYEPSFPLNKAYMENGIWFTSGKLSPENKPRVIYPGVAALLNIDPHMNFEFYLRPSYYQAIPGLKERAWINDEYRLVVRTTISGAILSLYSRSDKAALHDLFLKPAYKSIAFKMLNEMNEYLISKGIEIVPSSNSSFFYAENITQ